MSTTKKLLSGVTLLAGYAPYTLAGYAEFRAVIDTDGAVPARLKALFAAVAAIDRRYPELARRELERGVTLGLELHEAVAGLIVLTSLRGEGAALEFADVVHAAFPDAQAPAAQPIPSAAAGEAEGNFREYFGTIPPALAALLRLVPQAADGYYLMRRGSIDANPISPKHGELLLLAILAAGYSPMAQRHVDGARRAGASDEEIAEATICAIPAAGIAAWMAVGGMLEPETARTTN
jgi:alkylhydroperoxidase/carboxymuconolactone decarboxylase family protein YurZ